jgi:hypothetical protein
LNCDLMWMICVPFSTPVNNRENGEHGWQDDTNDLVKCAGGFGTNENAKANRHCRVRRRLDQY